MKSEIEQIRPRHFSECKTCRFADFVMDKSLAVAKVSKKRAVSVEVSCSQPMGKPEFPWEPTRLTGKVEYVSVRLPILGGINGVD